MSEEIKAMVCVGAPFEAQTFYGPFDTHDEAVEWAEHNLRNEHFTWIVSLYSPKELE